MKALILLYFFLAYPAWAGPVYRCGFSFFGSPTTHVSLDQLGENEFADFVTVEMQGKSRRESFTPVERRPEELVHGWISKEVKDGSIEMTVYRGREGTSLPAKLVNPHVPFGKEVRGSCEVK